MDPDSHLLMQQFVEKHGHNLPGARVLEVGSQDINGTPRQYFTAAKEYIGIDIIPGPKVDVLLETPDVFPFAANDFDYVISQNCLEHCKHPWLTVCEMARVLKPGGYFFASAPWRFQVHKDGLCPQDCYRILDDGMIALIEYAGLKVIEARMYQDFTIGIGQKF